jgi:hypothetical protein
VDLLMRASPRHAYQSVVLSGVNVVSGVTFLHTYTCSTRFDDLQKELSISIETVISSSVLHPSIN